MSRTAADWLPVRNILGMGDLYCGYPRMKSNCSRCISYNTRFQCRRFAEAGRSPECLCFLINTYCVGDVMKKFVLAATVASVLAASPAFAAEDAGFYVGAGLGNMSLDSDSIYGRDFDGSDTGFKVFAGYKFMPWLALEAEYLDGGEPEDVFRSEDFPDERLKVTAGVSGFIGSAVGILPIGESFDVFAKAGFIYWDGDGSGKIRNDQGTLEKVSYGNDGTDFAWAVGGTWYFMENLGLRAEYQGFEISDFSSVAFASASVTWSF
jgi:OOP family OmpA-OmpF porin